MKFFVNICQKLKQPMIQFVYPFEDLKNARLIIEEKDQNVTSLTSKVSEQLRSLSEQELKIDELNVLVTQLRQWSNVLARNDFLKCFVLGCGDSLE